MRAWREFEPHVLLWVTGCPSFTVDHYVRQAAIEFLDRSGAFRRRVWLPPVGPGQYSLQPPGEARLIRLRGLSDADGDIDLRGARAEVCGGVVKLDPPAASQLMADLVLVPTQDAEGVEDDIFELHVEPIAELAAAKLMMLPQRPWTDQRTAASIMAGMGARYGFAAHQAAGRDPIIVPFRP